MTVMTQAPILTIAEMDEKRCKDCRRFRCEKCETCHLCDQLAPGKREGTGMSGSKALPWIEADRTRRDAINKARADYNTAVQVAEVQLEAALSAAEQAFQETVRKLRWTELGKVARA